ncbi:MAG: hypothetical protein U5Q16_10325 [Gammaproteobacteria bacterium]|nr:hypothetical protein [Gammaproteobacteria bacterium]
MGIHVRVIAELRKSTRNAFPTWRRSINKGVRRAMVLASLDTDNDEIEKFFIPVMLLINEIDVGHALLGDLLERVKHAAYVHRSRRREVMEMIERVIQKLQDQTGLLPATHGGEPAGDNTKKIVKTIGNALERQ